jgi:hypothetical protein
MSCSTIQLPATRKGDTWDGMTVALSSTGTTFADSLSAVHMSFWLAGATTAALDLKSADSEVTIDDAAAWEFTVDPVSPMTLAAGQYSWQIQTTDSAGVIKTYLSGTIEITSDQTV